jgi:hypothetical protein
MGARSYLPELGIFTATDPVEGGNTTTYAYPQDPINHSDLTGTCDGLWGCLGAGVGAVGSAIANATESASVWLTNSEWGKRIKSGCDYTWGMVSMACSAVYAGAYARQGRWAEAGRELAIGVAGFAAGRVGRAAMTAATRAATTKAFRVATTRVARRAILRRQSRATRFAENWFGSSVSYSLSNLW